MSNENTVLITGASGTIGQYLVDALKKEGFSIICFSHSKNYSAGTKTFPWNPKDILGGANRPHLVEALESADIVINLAGSPIAKGRLTPDHRKRVLESRIDATNALIALAEKAETKPRLWIQGSAVGFYGNTGTKSITEKSNKGQTVLADIVQKWEHSVTPVKKWSNTRLVIARFGVVFAKDAPAWKKIKLPILFGIGGRLGPGSQYLSWISVVDVVNAIFHFIANDSTGIYNLTSPQPETQLNIATLAAEHYDRPIVIPTPAWILRIALGKLADELVLCSCKAHPSRLVEEEFSFLYPSFESTLSLL